MYINDRHVLHTMKPLSRLNLSVNTRYEIYLCTKLVYISLHVLCKEAYICHNIHDDIFAEFDFEETHYSREWQWEMIVKLHVILYPAYASNLQYFIFKKRIKLYAWNM